MRMLLLWMVWCVLNADATRNEKRKLCGLVQHNPLGSTASSSSATGLVGTALVSVATVGAVAAAGRQAGLREGFACGPLAGKPCSRFESKEPVEIVRPELDLCDKKGVRRPLAPVVRAKAKASFSRARAALASADARAAARKALEEDFYARTSTGPRAARWKGMLELGRGAAPPFELLPVTTQKLFDIAAALKAGSYRSADAYLGILKKEHLIAGHPWTENLGTAMADAVRSVKRGIGPSGHAGDFDLSELAAIQGGSVTCTGGPEVPRETGICMALWMLRGLEAASLLGCQAEILEGRGLARLNLGPTKTDTAGRGALRTLRCACADEVSHALAPMELCPVAALEKVLAVRRARGRGVDDLLFGGQAGQATTASGISNTFSALLAKDVTEHSFRRAGAQYFARCGVSEAHIMFHGRWGSAAVRRYIGEALAGQTTDAVMRATRAESNPTVPRQLAGAAFGEVAELLRQVGETAKDALQRESGVLLQKAAEAARAIVLAHSSEVEAEWLALGGVQLGGVRSAGSCGRGATHRVALGDPAVPSVLWTTSCGWNFGRGPHLRTGTASVTCKKCLEWA